MFDESEGRLGAFLQHRAGRWLESLATGVHSTVRAGERPESEREGGSMRTGNALVDVIIEIVVIVLVAAIVVWILSAVGAPGIVSTIVWVLAALAVVLVLLRLLRMGGAGMEGRGRMRRRAP